MHTVGPPESSRWWIVSRSPRAAFGHPPADDSVRPHNRPRLEDRIAQRDMLIAARSRISTRNIGPLPPALVVHYFKDYSSRRAFAANAISPPHALIAPFAVTSSRARHALREEC